MYSFERLKAWAGSNLRGRLSPSYHDLLLASDSAGWVLDEEAKEMIKIAAAIGFRAYFTVRPGRSLRQCVHYTSFFSLARKGVFDSNHRISVDYFHGKPNQDRAFLEVFEAMRKNAHRIHRLRLSYSGMMPFALEAGVPASRIHRIPIGVNGAYFPPQTNELRRSARIEFGLPESAVVVGSFQKDGQGWGDGMEPKAVKAPDVFLRSMEILREDVSELYVLLTGPARGYVKSGLERLGIPYRHFLLKDYPAIGRFYNALDFYVVASREEGGPKAVLESMSAGVPLVTTRVGQAIDLVNNGQNAMLVEVDDAEAIANASLRIIQDSSLRKIVIAGGLNTARENTYVAQMPMWRRFFDGYVESN